MSAIYRAIVIDDEKLIREGLVHYIDWASLGVTVCAVCADGISGMEAVLAQRPHIILLDISMPNLDGILLLEQVRAHGLGCEVIFISSYSNFDYAQKAVKLGAFDYLLKPIEASVLYEAVQRCVDKLKIFHQAGASISDDVHLDKMLRDALTTLPQSEQVFLNLARRCGLPVDSGVVLVLGAHCPPSQLQNAVKQSSWASCTLTVEVSPTLTVSCLFLEQGNAADCSWGLTEALRSMGLAAVATECHRGVYSGFVDAQMQLLTIVAPRSEPAQLPRSGKGLPTATVESLNLNQLESELAYFLAECYRIGALSNLVDFMMRCSAFLEYCYQQLEQYYGKPLQGCRGQQQYLEELHGCNNVVDMYVCLGNLFSEIFGALRARSMMSPYTRRALHTLRQDYAQNLSLKQIAPQLNISTSHLRAVFKEDTGYSFSDYLYQYRMNKAQELIKTGSYKVYEVGALVGYPDMVQFSKRFKKFFGYSPKQWQRSTLGQEG